MQNDDPAVAAYREGLERAARAIKRMLRDADPERITWEETYQLWDLCERLEEIEKRTTS